MSFPLAARAQDFSSFTITKSPDGQDVRLSWPGSLASWLLTSNPNLDPGGWRPVEAVAFLDGGRFTVEVPITDSTMYFRLESTPIIFVDTANASAGDGSLLNPFPTIASALAEAVTRFQKVGTPQTVYVFEGDYPEPIMLEGSALPELAVNLLDSSTAIWVDGVLVGGTAKARIRPPTGLPALELYSLKSIVLSGFDLAASGGLGVCVNGLDHFGVDRTCLTVDGGGFGFSLEHVDRASGLMSRVAITGGGGIRISAVGGSFGVDDGDPNTPADTVIGPGSSKGIEIFAASGSFRFADLEIRDTESHGVFLVDSGEVELCRGTIDGARGDAVCCLNTDLSTNGLSVGLEETVFGTGFFIQSNNGEDQFYRSVNDSIFGVAGGGWNIIKSRGGTLTAALLAPFNHVQSGRNLHATTWAGPDSLRLALWGFSFSADADYPAIELTGHDENSLIMTQFDQGQIVSEVVRAYGARLDGVTFDADPNAPGIQPVIGTGRIQFGSNVPPEVPADGQRVPGNVLQFLNPSGELHLAQLDIAGKGGAGLLVDTTGRNTDFALRLASGTIDVNEGPVMDLKGLKADLTFTNLRSRQSPTSGILIEDVSGSILATEVILLEGSAGNPISIVNSPNLAENFP